MNIENVSKEVIDIIVAKAEAGRTVEDITVLLFMNEVYSTKAEARSTVTAVFDAYKLKPAKKESMADQLKTWFHAQPDPLAVTKEQLKKQIEAIGMQGGSVQWYTRVYIEAIAIAKKLNETK